MHGEPVHAGGLEPDLHVGRREVAGPLADVESEVHHRRAPQRGTGGSATGNERLSRSTCETAKAVVSSFLGRLRDAYATPASPPLPRMRVPLVGPVLTVALLATPLVATARLGAQEADTTAVAARDTATIVSQLELNEREARRHAAADSALNATWRELRRRLPAGRFDRLRVAQRRWVAAREAACSGEAATAHGGQAESMIWHGCMATAAEVRTRELRVVLATPKSRRG
jgi:uncharacterized protein YecT (DUF1311 family)